MTLIPLAVLTIPDPLTEAEAKYLDYLLTVFLCELGKGEHRRGQVALHFDRTAPE